LHLHCEEWILSEGNFSKLKVFQNTVIGMPWENRKNAIAYEKVMLRKGGYDSRHLPNDVKPLLITCGVDIQADRIELEVVAFVNLFASCVVDDCLGVAALTRGWR
jgi:phage terminase large subunit GpA-like protein